MDPWQMVRILLFRTLGAGSRYERHLFGDFWNETWGSSAAPEVRSRFRLGGEILAKHEERKGSGLAQSAALLFDGCCWSLDGMLVSTPHIVY